MAFGSEAEKQQEQAGYGVPRVDPRNYGSAPQGQRDRPGLASATKILVGEIEQIEAFSGRLIEVFGLGDSKLAQDSGTPFGVSAGEMTIGLANRLSAARARLSQVLQHIEG